jgi:hypothetical protein
LSNNYSLKHLLTMKTAKKTIENKLNKTVNIFKASDGFNLLFTAKIDGLTVAYVYKSFDQNFNEMQIIKYVSF